MNGERRFRAAKRSSANLPTVAIDEIRQAMAEALDERDDSRAA
jgi:hypothetical protein